MALHFNHHGHHDHDQYRWERPPQVEVGQTARVNAPRATARLERQTPAPEATAPSVDAS